jgi:hypothetical protein
VAGAVDGDAAHVMFREHDAGDRVAGGVPLAQLQVVRVRGPPNCRGEKRAVSGIDGSVKRPCVGFSLQCTQEGAVGFVFAERCEEIGGNDGAGSEKGELDGDDAFEGDPVDDVMFGIGNFRTVGTVNPEDMEAAIAPSDVVEFPELAALPDNLRIRSSIERFELGL